MKNNGGQIGYWPSTDDRTIEFLHRDSMSLGIGQADNLGWYPREDERVFPHHSAWRDTPATLRFIRNGVESAPGADSARRPIASSLISLGCLTAHVW